MGLLSYEKDASGSYPAEPAVERLAATSSLATEPTEIDTVSVGPANVDAACALDTGALVPAPDRPFEAAVAAGSAVGGVDTMDSKSPSSLDHSGVPKHTLSSSAGHLATHRGSCAAPEVVTVEPC